MFCTGYHQKCHAPRIEEEIKNPDVDWQCRTCVFDQTAKHGGAVKKGTLAKDMQVMKQTLPYNVSTGISFLSIHNGVCDGANKKGTTKGKQGMKQNHSYIKDMV